MTLVLDAAPLVALADAKEPQLEALLRIRDEEKGQLVLPAPVAAEVDYLLGVRFGEAARRAFLSDLAARRYDVACLEADDYRAVSELDIRYSDLGLGLADCGSRRALRNPTSAQLRRATFPGRCATSGRVLRVAAGRFLAGLAAGTFARPVESLRSNGPWRWNRCRCCSRSAISY